MIWNTSPVMVSLGPLEIRWYGLFFAAAFLLGQGYMLWRLKQDDGGIWGGEDEIASAVDSMLLYLIVGTLIGARLAHCLFYDPGYYLANPLEIPMLWRGGLASHGGLVGFLVSLHFFCRKQAFAFWALLDRLAIPAILGGALIRMGNFFNSEIVGHPADVPWAVIFARIDATPRHPVQLYESFSYAAIFLLLFICDRAGVSKSPKRLSGLFLITVFSTRLILESFKTTQAFWADGLPITMGQMLSLPMIAAGFVLIVWPYFGKNRGEGSRLDI
ncbi:prolipoprotein diacylglyceryl transferase [Desulfoluna sp.]|uniref:prolipoprotein diacylglyceryl transferase n=1 Tax=Desulfoluna sp. TaxID=2045199 RepID=UPI0026258DC4|nr:prolipoprotein diacylglyceryl transferase [Desulfoluna sp.]